MTQPAQSNIFDPYADMASWSAVVTGVCILVKPVVGAAVGVYFVTGVLTRAAFDASGIEEAGALGKAAKFALSFLAGTLTALGVTVSLTPQATAYVIAVTAFHILLGFIPNGYDGPNCYCRID